MSFGARHITAALALTAVVAGTPGHAVDASAKRLDAMARVGEVFFAVTLSQMIASRCTAMDWRGEQALGDRDAIFQVLYNEGFSEEDLRWPLQDDRALNYARAQMNDYTAARGFDPVTADEAGWCALGREELKTRSRIGTYLEAK